MVRVDLLHMRELLILSWGIHKTTKCPEAYCKRESAAATRGEVGRLVFILPRNVEFHRHLLSSALVAANFRFKLIG